MIQESILASLHGTANNLIMDAAIASLRVLATQTHTQIEVSTAGSTISVPI